MKKILFLCLFVLLISTGCGKMTKDDVVKKFEKNINSSNSYKITGKMEIFNGEDLFNYNLEANHLKDDYYKVILINESNNHEQIILRNDDGVYVITPALNKSFKFDSVWPENSSQAYLLESLFNDVNKDNKAKFNETETGYVIQSNVNYPNNSDLSYQKVYFNKEGIPEKVEVYDKNDNVKIKVIFTKIDFKAKLNKNDFDLNKYISEGNCDEECQSKTTGSLDSIIYPLFIPANTYLTDSKKINNESVNRVILTFAGDKNFVLVEDVSRVNEEFEIIPINGEPMMLNDTIGALSNNSIYFTKNNINYYIVSNDLTNEEMVNVALSVGSTNPVISTK